MKRVIECERRELIVIKAMLDDTNLWEKALTSRMSDLEDTINMRVFNDVLHYLDKGVSVLGAIDIVNDLIDSYVKAYALTTAGDEFKDMLQEQWLHLDDVNEVLYALEGVI